MKLTGTTWIVVILCLRSLIALRKRKEIHQFGTGKKSPPIKVGFLLGVINIEIKQK
jgi:hypothetical protein